MDQEAFLHVIFRNVLLISLIFVVSLILYNEMQSCRREIKQAFTECSSKSDSKWEATNARIDHTYNIILEELRTRKQEKN